MTLLPNVAKNIINMKKLFTLLFVAISFGASAQKTLIDYWNFNPVINAANPVTGDTALAKNPVIALVPGTSITYTGSYTDLVTDAGDTTNLRIPETNTALEMSFRCRSPYGPLFFNVPTSGYNGIVVKYGEFRSGSGAGLNTVTYTTDGVTWDSVGLQITDGIHATTTGVGTYTVDQAALPLDLVILDFSNVPGANNNPKFRIQIAFSGATGGNDRFDNISVEGTPIATPLLLQSFNGAIANNNSKLWWTSNNEINVKEFVIESSIDNKAYNVIGEVAAKNQSGIQSYSFESAALTTSAFYRLKIVDENGAFSYSPIVVLRSGGISGLSVFPNPAVNSITLSHERAIDNAHIEIISVDGKKLFNTGIQAGATQTSINVSNLAKGTYQVSFLNNGITTTTKFVK